MRTFGRSFAACPYAQTGGGRGAGGEVCQTHSMLAAPTPPRAGPGVPLIAVVGATATGKSALAIAIAVQLNGEVVGADAMQLYRGMDVGTAKVPVAQRVGVPHHQIDVLDVQQDASLAAYQHHVRADIDSIAGRGAVPVLVGGSGLYVRAAMDHLDIPPTDADVRAGLEARLRAEGADSLHAELARVDPVAAQRILPTNARRIVRALEVNALTGQPFSATMPTRSHLRPTLVIGLRLPREELDRRIDARTWQMWSDGLLAEVDGLCEKGLRAARTASRALGYSQALAQLDGMLSRQEAIEQTARATRRYARRQESWFGADPRVRWFDAGSPGHVEAVLGSVHRAMAHNEDR